MELEDFGNLISHRFHAVNENLLSAIVDGYIYFSSPDGFNDPYDCRIRVENSIENARRNAGDAHKAILDFYSVDLLDKIKDQVRQVGVACFSREISNTLMWAHYAKNHSGVVLTYEIPPTFISENSPELLGWGRVGYGSNIIEEFFSSLEPDKAFSNYLNFIEPLLIRLLATKAPAWEYEQEFRIVKAEPGRFGIDRTFLRQVCFGLATTTEHIDLVKRMISEHGYGDVIFAKMERHKNHDFGFEAVPLAD